MTQEEFVMKSTSVHNNFYNYSKVEYKDEKTPVTIICPVHGEFSQRPERHLAGKGCPKCAWLKPDGIFMRLVLCLFFVLVFVSFFAAAWFLAEIGNLII